MGCLKEGMTVDAIIIGGDARFGWLARLLQGRGATVGTLQREGVPGVAEAGVDALSSARLAVVNCPAKAKDLSLESILEALPEGAKLALCGPKRYEGNDARAVDLWTDEQLLRENALLTAEGAVSAAMRAGDGSLRGQRCMVIGWGRIGRALTELLVGIGARVTVASRSAQKRNRAVERGAEATLTDDLAATLPGHRLVFNTAPRPILGKDALRCAERDAMLIDLASEPYGIDLHAAWKLGLRAWREPNLPGRYCPQSAANALFEAMQRADLMGGTIHG